MLSNGVFYLPILGVFFVYELQVEMYLIVTSFASEQISVQHKVLIGDTSVSTLLLHCCRTLLVIFKKILFS